MGEGLGKGDIAGFFSGFGACEVKRLGFGIWCMQALVLTLTRRCIAWCRTHVPRRRRGCSICLSPLPSLPTHLVLAFLSSLGPCVYPCGPRACLLGCLLGIRLVCSLALHGYQGLVSCVSRSCLLLALHGYRGLVSCSLTQCTLLLNPPQHFANVAVTDLGQSCEMIRVPADLVDSGARPPVYRLLRSIVLLLCPADSLLAWSCLLACLLACLLVLINHQTSCFVSSVGCCEAEGFPQQTSLPPHLSLHRRCTGLGAGRIIFFRFAVCCGRSGCITRRLFDLCEQAAARQRDLRAFLLQRWHAHVCVCVRARWYPIQRAPPLPELAVFLT
jgi:hypothetical protein